MSIQIKGTIYTLVAGIAWGISGVSGQYLMSHGYHVNLVTSLRMIISGIFLISLALLKNKNQVKQVLGDKKSLINIGLFAIFGLLLNQYAYLTAIASSNAGTATVLQYLCPILLLIYSCLTGRRLPALMELMSIILAIAGTFLMATHGQLNQLTITPSGLFWGIFSAFTYALYIILPAQVIRKWGSTTVIGLGMVAGGIVFSLASQVWTYDLPLDSKNLLALLGIIGIGTIFAYTVFLKGASIVGPVKSSLLASIEPIASVFFAVLIMKEIFYPIDLLGMAAILLAVLIITLKDLKKQEKSDF